MEGGRKSGVHADAERAIAPAGQNTSRASVGTRTRVPALFGVRQERADHHPAPLHHSTADPHRAQGTNGGPGLAHV
jgi:hypothetical protein